MGGNNTKSMSSRIRLEQPDFDDGSDIVNEPCESVVSSTTEEKPTKEKRKAAKGKYICMLMVHAI